MAHKPKLGSGARFASGVKSLEAKGMPASEAKAVMAKAGREKYGAKKMAELSAHGRKHGGQSHKPK